MSEPIEELYVSRLNKSRNGKLVFYQNMVIVCANCGKEFTSKNAHAGYIPKFCSMACYGKSLLKPSICKQCGHEYFTSHKHGKRNKLYCSKKCASLAQIDKPLSDSAKRKLSEFQRGKPIPYLHTKSIREKISKALRGKPQYGRRGKNHHNYKDGGASRYSRLREMGLIEYKTWRRSVFERDDYTCRECGNRGKRLIAHHVKPWALFKKLRYDINNGITLCRACHIKSHSGVGSKITGILHEAVS